MAPEVAAIWPEVHAIGLSHRGHRTSEERAAQRRHHQSHDVADHKRSLSHLAGLK
jgi:hypothetical protein